MNAAASAACEILHGWGGARTGLEMLEADVDERAQQRRPAEDYAHAVVTFENAEGDVFVAEATTSWSFVGAGLRLHFELLGPEYSMSVNSLQTEAQIFLSRNL